jgi:hypothetical protein
MARGRMLSKSLSTSWKRARLHAVIGPLAEFAQGLYPLLIAHADDFGREAGDVFTVKHQIDPTSPRSLDDFQQALAALHTVGLIVWYMADDRGVIQIVDYDAHQVGLHRRTHSKFPEPTADSGTFPELPASRARAELNRTELNLSTRTRSAPPTRPVEKPKVPTLAAMVRDELLPKGFEEGDLMEAAKRLAARLKLKYSSAAIRRAIDSARAQTAKRPRGARA